MNEVDATVGRAPLGGVVQEAHAAVAQGGRDRVDVGDTVRQLLQTRTVAVEELGDRGLVAQRREQLDAGAGVADGEHRLTHALLLVDLLVDRLEAEDPRVELDRVVEVGDGDADVVDGGEQVARNERFAGHGPQPNTGERDPFAWTTPGVTMKS